MMLTFAKTSFIVCLVERNKGNIMKQVTKSNGLPWFEMDIPDKEVVCARCFTKYNLKDAPLKAPDQLRIKEPICPTCKYKWYLSN